MTPRPEVPLQVITPTVARASVARARRNLERAARELAWQVERESWRTLGYPSWAAFREAEYDAAAFMVPSKSHSGWQVVNATPEPDADKIAATRSCEGCGEAMTGRADRRYCSSACRQRAYRRRVTA